METYKFSFIGKGSEYFRIWIVNLFLSIITLGIYSAWAKVRTKRWFYENTLLDSHGFTYLATPWQILKGRLIAATFFIVYTISSEFFPPLAILLSLILMLLVPWIIRNSLRFNARMSSYRGIRFNFNGSIGEAYKVHLLYPILSVLTLGLLLPYSIYAQVRYLALNYTYGDLSYRYDTSSWSFWKLFLRAFLLSVIPVAILITLGARLLIGISAEEPDEMILSIKALLDGATLLVLLFYVWIFCIFSFIKTHIINLFYNHIISTDMCFAASLRARDVVWIQISNLVLTICTLGLFIPFAKVRLARYKAEHIELSATSLEVLSGKISSRVGALGSEMGDLFDIDTGI
ncbi:MAG: YjgN family protein [Wolinella sp.]